MFKTTLFKKAVRSEDTLHSLNKGAIDKNRKADYGYIAKK
jgi:hypothetical protein